MLFSRDGDKTANKAVIRLKILSVVTSKSSLHNTPTHKGRLPKRHFAILTNVALPSSHNLQEIKPVNQIANF